MNGISRGTVCFLMGLSLGFALLELGCSKDTQTAHQDTAATAKGSAHPPAEPPRAQAQPITLPAGTKIQVLTTSTLSTESHAAGQTFTAHLQQPLTQEGHQIVPKGAEVEGVIVNADKGGRVKGRAKITVRLTKLRPPGGHPIEISSSTVTRTAQATKGKDAAKIGIGSGVGAAIGAIAGGGKGAAVGAAAGAGAGTGLVLATRGGAAVIPGETVLNFELRSPVSIAQSH